VAEERVVVQGGVPRAAPRQFPIDAFSPEAIERFENARRLKQQEATQEEQ